MSAILSRLQRIVMRPVASFNLSSGQQLPSLTSLCSACMLLPALNCDHQQHYLTLRAQSYSSLTSLKHYHHQLTLQESLLPYCNLLGRNIFTSSKFYLAKLPLPPPTTVVKNGDNLFTF